MKFSKFRHVRGMGAPSAKGAGDLGLCKDAATAVCIFKVRAFWHNQYGTVMKFIMFMCDCLDSQSFGNEACVPPPKGGRGPGLYNDVAANACVFKVRPFRHCLNIMVLS